MRRPDFWQIDGPVSKLLAPVGWAYDGVGQIRRNLTQSYRPPVPVICIGNIVAGGAGKTPVAMALGDLLIANGDKPHFLTRGYGGKHAGPLQVDLAIHDAAAVGDEALLLAEIAPCWVSRNRAEGARAAVKAGAGLIIMDDGFQNMQLAKDLSLIVVDGGFGFGNGRTIPAGPLRESLQAGIGRADAAIVIGADTTGAEAALGDQIPVLSARFVPAPGGPSLAGRPVIGFAGIGRPEKFFATLRETGCDLKAVHGFPDHCVFTAEEIAVILEQAAALNATVVTTAKDAVRLPIDARNLIEILRVMLEWEDPDHLSALVQRTVKGPR